MLLNLWKHYKKALSVVLSAALILPALAAFPVMADGKSNAGSNNIENYSTDNVTAAGKWSYFSFDPDKGLDGLVYLKKADGTKKFPADEFTIDPNNGNHVWYVKSTGAMGTDLRTIAWNFTLSSDYEDTAQGVNIKGSLGNQMTRLRILKTSDTSSDTLSGKLETLYDVTAETHNFDFMVPSEKCKEGNDILFVVTKASADNWGTALTTNFYVKGMNVPQANETLHSPAGPSIKPGSEVTITSSTEGAKIYYTVDGSDPSKSSTRKVYNTPIKITGTMDMKSCATKPGMENSDTTSTHYIIDYPIRDFLGICNGPVTQVEGLKFVRLDLSWSTYEPEKGKYNEKVFDDFGKKVLDYRKLGYETLPILAFTPTWAVNKKGYKFTHHYTGDVYEYGPAVQKTVNGKLQDVLNRRVYNIWRELTSERDITVSNKMQIDEAYVTDWQNYVRKAVEKFSNPPYNLEYFQIWNEAYPSSSFYNGSLEQYMDCIHVPAAKVMREFKNVKIVYGGWACGGPVSEFVQMLDYAHAWDLVDVYDMHYMPLSAMDYIYKVAQERGVKNPMVWQTELGFSPQAYYPPNMYSRTLRWALEKGMYKVNNDLVKLFWFANGSPDDPKAYGWNYSIMAGTRMTSVGKTIKAFSELFSGEKLEAFNNFKTSLNLRPEISEMKSSAEGFLLNDRKAIMAIHLVKENYYSNLVSDVNGTGEAIDLSDPNTGISVDVTGISGAVKVMRVDIFGNKTALEYENIDDHTIRVKVPVQDTNDEVKKASGGDRVQTMYLTVEAEDGIKNGDLTTVNY